MPAGTRRRSNRPSASGAGRERGGHRVEGHRRPVIEAARVGNDADDVAEPPGHGQLDVDRQLAELEEVHPAGRRRCPGPPRGGRRRARRLASARRRGRGGRTAPGSARRTWSGTGSTTSAMAPSRSRSSMSASSRSGRASRAVAHQLRASLGRSIGPSKWYPDSATSLRSRSRQRIRVGPMDPIGMSNAAETSA